MKKFIIVYALVCMLLTSTVLISCSNQEATPPQDKPVAAEYPVISVDRYIVVHTNYKGAVLEQIPAYMFVYTDDEEIPHTVSGFVPDDYSLEKLRIGDTDKYVVTGDGHEILYLTRDTLNRLTGSMQP